jgi:hypothetical protein
VAGLTSDFRKSDGGFAELKHGAMIAVGWIGNPEDVRREA